VPARVYAPTLRNLRRLAAALRRGELVAIPTETVYGLAANALDARACRRIFKAKRRPADDPLIVHVPNLRAAEQLAEFTAAARVLARHFWPGPLTLVLPRKPVVPAIVTSGQATVALRAPAHPLARRLLKLTGLPLAAPSANLFGYVSPTTAQHVQAGLGRRIEHILDGGACQVGVESTIVDVSEPGFIHVLRPGAISAREMLAVLRRAGLKARTGRKHRRTPLLVPGLLDQHYSPHTPLELRRHLGAADRKSVKPGTALICLKKNAGRNAPNVFSFSRTGRLPEIARNLYAVLRRADAGGFERILVESLPAGRKDALAVAINDRLKRAAGQRSAAP
jgi:L-threonylcarbamoyladenylate synthase